MEQPSLNEAMVRVHASWCDLSIVVNPRQDGDKGRGGEHRTKSPVARRSLGPVKLKFGCVIKSFVWRKLILMSGALHWLAHKPAKFNLASIN